MLNTGSRSAFGLLPAPGDIRPASEAMNCPSCNAAVQEGDSFCIHCGASLPRAPGPAAAASEPEPPSPPEAAPSMATQRPDAVASTKYDSKGRWIALAVLLVCVFLLAAVGGYLLQRNGSESAPQEGLAAVQPVPGTTEDRDAPPVDSLTTAESAASAGMATGAENPGGASGTHTAPSAVAGNAAVVTGGRETAAASSSAAPPKRVSEPVRAQPKQSRQEGGTTPPPAVPPAAVPTPAVPTPGIPARTSATPATPMPPAAPPSAPDATIVAEGETFGGTTPARRAAPNTRVLKPDAQAPPASPTTPPSAQTGLRPAPPAAPAVEEGILYWTGRLRKNQVITIEAGSASVGQVEGKLPGIPVDVWLPSPAVVLAERPNPDNNWGRVAFRCVRDTNRNVTINVQWKRLR